MQTVFETDYLLLRYREGLSTDLLVITFSPFREDAAKSHEGFGEKLLSSEGIACIHITCADNRWYQYPELPEIGPSTEQIRSRYAQIVLYGDSMGGYAALIAARWLRPTRIIAVAPQFSANPAKIAFDPHWAYFGRNITWLWDDMHPIEACETILLYDNYYIDSLHADRIRECTGALPLRFPFASHSVLGFLKEVGVIRALTLDLLRGHNHTNNVRVARRNRSSSAIYWLSLATGLGGTRSKIECLRRAAALNPKLLAIHYRLAETLLIASRFEEAIESYNTFLVKEPSAGWVLHRRSLAQRNLGRLHDALLSSQRASELMPSHAGVHLLLGDLLSDTGNHLEAAAALKLATIASPNDPHCWTRLSQEYLHLQDFPSALQAAIFAERLRPNDPGYANRTDKLMSKLIRANEKRSVGASFPERSKRPDVPS